MNDFPHLPTVSIVDGDQQLIAAVVAFLQERSIETLGFTSAADFLNQRPAVDCLIINLQLSDRPGDDLHAQLHEEGEPAAVIVTTRRTATAKIVAAMHRGAVTVLEKPYELTALHGHVQKALDLADAHRQLRHQREALAIKIARLTRREREVFELLLTGKHVKQIGLELGIGIKTVHTFRANLMQKMESDSNSDLIRRVALAFGSDGLERICTSADQHTLATLIAR